MKPIFRIVLFAFTVVVLAGCSAEQPPAAAANPAGGLTPGQEAQAKTLGITTANDVKQNPGMYTGDINYAKSGVQDEQKRVEAENAAVKAMSPH